MNLRYRDVPISKLNTSISMILRYRDVPISKTKPSISMILRYSDASISKFCNPISKFCDPISKLNIVPDIGSHLTRPDIGSPGPDTGIYGYRVPDTRYRVSARFQMSRAPSIFISGHSFATTGYGIPRFPTDSDMQKFAGLPLAVTVTSHCSTSPIQVRGRRA